MGKQLLDQYSLLHWASGVIAYFWDVPVDTFFLAHVSFEVAENTDMGISFINKNLTWWPGGKRRRDTFVNILGDNAVAVLGWYCASKLDQTGKDRGWHE